MNELGHVDENLKAVLDTLCPEMKEAFLTLAKHFKSCEKCRLVLAGYGAPIYLQTQRSLILQEHAIKRISSGLVLVSELLAAATGDSQNERVH